MTKLVYNNYIYVYTHKYIRIKTTIFENKCTITRQVHPLVHKYYSSSYLIVYGLSHNTHITNDTRAQIFPWTWADVSILQACCVRLRLP